MIDKFNRRINYLRIAVTNRCNLRCYYCRPENEKFSCCDEKKLPLKKIVSIVAAAAKLGIDKIRLTGGEPLLRSDIVQLVKEIAAISGIKDLAMTTNGILLAQYAAGLAAAGLKRINISLDTTDPERFKQITRGGNIASVFAGIESAKKANLLPIKINCVIAESSDEPDAKLVKQFADENGFHIRFIRLMSFQKGNFSVVEGGMGGDCKNCNRLRVLADGRILPCLFSDKTFSIDELGIENAFREALENKPEKGLACKHDWMKDIGG